MSVVIPSLRPAIAVPGWAKNELWRKAQAVPSLDLRFADNKSLVDATTGQNLVTFSRASGGTYVDSQGAIRTALDNEPRFDHNPSTGESLGLLVEEPRTNLLLRSEEFDNAYWGKGAASVDPNVSTSPSGTATADKLIEDTSTAEHQTTGFPSLTSGVTYTTSIYVKAAGRTFVRFGFAGTGFAAPTRSTFNLSTGTIAQNAGGNPVIAPAGNGWYRLSVTNTATSTTTGLILIQPALDATTFSYLGDGTSGVYLWGAQLEAGAFPTSYIPTTDTAATRVADIAEITGTNFSSWYSQSEGTVFTEAIPSSTIGNGIVGFDDGTSAERWRIGHTGTTAGTFVVVDGGVVQTNLQTTAGSWPVDTSGKSAAALRLNNSAVSSNGQSSAEDLACTIPTVTQMTIGTAQAIGYAGARISRITYWPQRLSNSTLQSITQ